MELSLILACYNEESHLKKSFEKLIAILKKDVRSFEIIFVEDKSDDNTLAIIHSIIKRNLNINTRLIAHKKNEGRGKSIADGIKVAKGTYVGYLDIDLEVSATYIQVALRKLDTYDVIVGKRDYGFTIATIHRYIVSKGYRLLTKIFLHLPVSDSEAGFKFFNRKKILPILKKAKNPGWFWDTEIVWYAHKSGLKIGEIPVLYKRRKDKKSTVNTIPDSIIYFKHLWKLYMKLGSKK